MELKISHGIIEGGGFARERSDQARGSLATEQGGGFPLSHGRELFHFST